MLEASYTPRSVTPETARIIRHYTDTKYWFGEIEYKRWYVREDRVGRPKGTAFALLEHFHGHGLNAPSVQPMNNLL